jgi:hypothetical protein
MTFAESLRAYADWCEMNPTLAQKGMIDIYGESAEQAKDIMLADTRAKLEIVPSHNIVYLNQQFGTLIVKHLLYKHDVCNQSIVDNKLVAVLKPEFAELVKP